MLAQSLKFETIGTNWQIDFFEPVSAAKLQFLQTELLATAEKFDQGFSRFRADSWVTEISQNPGLYVLPEHAYELIKFYQQLYQISNGAFTPCIGQTLSDAGYGASYSLQPTHLSPPPKFDEIEITPETISTEKSVLLDFGGAGKGYLIDILAKLLRNHGIKDFWIDGSGDIFNHRLKTMRIGLENPDNPAQVIGIAELRSHKSLCASAGNRRAWDKYHHIINPKTLKSPKNILATWVIADTAFLADGLATALFLVKPKKLAAHFKFEYCLLGSDHQIQTSPNFPAKLFI